MEVILFLLIAVYLLSLIGMVYFLADIPKSSLTKKERYRLRFFTYCPVVNTLVPLVMLIGIIVYIR